MSYEIDTKLLQKAAYILYRYARDDYALTYPERIYDDEIIEEQNAAREVFKVLQQFL